MNYRLYTYLFFTCVLQALAQVEELNAAGADDQVRCFSCCTDLVRDEAGLLEASCQTGCDNNINGIDSTVQAQVDSFNVGDSFRRLGLANFNNRDYFCSVGGSTQRKFDDVDQADCTTCCNSINNQFDVDDVYDVQACIDACADNFVDECNDLALIEEQLGCAIGLLFRSEGVANFLENTNHFCSNLGELFSLNAIEIAFSNQAGVAQDSECSLCCDELEIETDITAAECKIGCDVTKVCANDAQVEADCDVGRSLALTSVAEIVGGSEVSCVAPGFLQKFVDLNELNQGLQAEDFAAVFGGTFGGVLALGGLAFFINRRRSRDRLEANIMEGNMSPPRRDFIESVGGFFSKFRPGNTFTGSVVNYPPAGNGQYGGDESMAYGKTNRVDPPKRGLFGRFRKRKEASGGDSRKDEPRRKGFLGRLRKKRKDDPRPLDRDESYLQNDRYYEGNNDGYGSRYDDDDRGGRSRYDDDYHGGRSRYDDDDRNGGRSEYENRRRERSPRPPQKRRRDPRRNDERSPRRNRRRPDYDDDYPQSSKLRTYTEGYN